MGVGYCSPECQKAHWKTHKPICQELQAGLVTIRKPAKLDKMQPIIDRATGKQKDVKNWDASGLSEEHRTGRAMFAIKVQVPTTPLRGEDLVDPGSPAEIEALKAKVAETRKRKDLGPREKQALAAMESHLKDLLSGKKPNKEVRKDYAAMIYDEHKTFFCSFKRSDDPDMYDRLDGAVRARGVGGVKAYFDAWLKDNGTRLVVHVQNALPAQAW